MGLVKAIEINAKGEPGSREVEHVKVVKNPYYP